MSYTKMLLMFLFVANCAFSLEQTNIVNLGRDMYAKYFDSATPNQIFQKVSNFLPNVHKNRTIKNIKEIDISYGVRGQPREIQYIINESINHFLINLDPPVYSLTAYIWFENNNDGYIYLIMNDGGTGGYRLFRYTLNTAQASAPPPQTTPQPAPNNMVRINGGTFTMGSPAGLFSFFEETGRYYDEVQHQVTISSFSIGKYEVTQKEWREVMKEQDLVGFVGDNMPMYASWFDAVNYCNARSQKEGLIPAYTINGETVTWNRNANGYRLPTEAEWEYACRSGTTTPYYSGTSVDNAGWHEGNSGNRPHLVGEKQPNAWGLYDMHGNVSEWCWDWYGEYSSGSQTNPIGASSGSYRVYRGGNWKVPARNARSASRSFLNNLYPPSSGFLYTGFRVVRP